ncbi:MAG: prepilin-type N-terminal cleavage/methylation domain-containing protein [Bacilli bacterium]
MQMPTNRKDSGFTLIEMAIVLVIIGLIIGAVLKGQDLIQNARAKKFVNFARAAEIAQWTYLDRKGHFNGDNDTVPDGAIESAPDWTGFTNEPADTLNLGSFNYDLAYGCYNSSGIPRNFILINPTSGSAFGEDELVFLESLDTAIDGVSNGTGGSVRGSDTAIDLTASGSHVISTFTNGTYSAGKTNAILYFFDRKID